jgi:hypothetical protein
VINPIRKRIHLFLAKHNALIYCLEACEKYDCEEYHGSSPSEQIKFDANKGFGIFGNPSMEVNVMKKFICDGCKEEIDERFASFELKKKTGIMTHTFGTDEEDKHFCRKECIDQWLSK